RTDRTGTVAIPNNYGVDLEFASSTGNVVGATAAGARNVISGNRFDGVLMGNHATGNLVQGNLIGTDLTGTAAPPHANNGVELFASAHDNTIGGNTVAARNVISGNRNAGVEIRLQAGTTANSVKGNFIGTDVSGAAALANLGSGVHVGQAASG